MLITSPRSFWNWFLLTAFFFFFLEHGSHFSYCKSESRSVMSDFVTPQTVQSMEFSRPEYLSGQPFPSPGDLPNPGIKPRSHALQVDSLPAEAQVKPKNTGMGSLSLLQLIFPTQELNQGLLHCRWILDQQSYQGSSNHIKCQLRSEKQEKE